MIVKYIVKFLSAIDKFCEGLAKTLTKKKKR